MPVCQACGKKWSWGQTFKTIFRLKCPYCGNKQYQSAATRKKTVWYAIIPLSWFPLQAIFDFKLTTAVVFVLIALAIVFVTMPFIIELSNEKERA
ncbi:TIGR04104 family putative zinc finger protein [Oceanobacillus alkalisoli]|uniref:TIGR04104 family putative zinc finger protein n=1 Tax=Oceanobacillus alkalisoli TaxID=2925113 RepID=UPI001EF112C0|nr:TIGR04104 family putative zinc finger protein [Oceanobacillus alkalisoli]MCF3944907.1 hypothetical protein [Oceanobacillus alkalisoli]MCG5105192.1 hypothetical protein [Oceanobacillus alkalisoli]